MDNFQMKIQNRSGNFDPKETFLSDLYGKVITPNEQKGRQEISKCETRTAVSALDFSHTFGYPITDDIYRSAPSNSYLITIAHKILKKSKMYNFSRTVFTQAKER